MTDALEEICKPGSRMYLIGKMILEMGRPPTLEEKRRWIKEFGVKKKTIDNLIYEMRKRGLLPKPNEETGERAIKHETEEEKGVSKESKEEGKYVTREEFREAMGRLDRIEDALEKLYSTMEKVNSFIASIAMPSGNPQSTQSLEMEDELSLIHI